MSDELTDRQREVLAAIEKHGSVSAAARALGVSRGTILNTRRAATRKLPVAPEVYAEGKVPPGYLRGMVTVKADRETADGRTVTTWERLHPDVSQAAVERVLAELEVPPAAIVPPPRAGNDRLLQVYPIGDAHFGMLAWQKETGHNYNLQIARDLMAQASSRLISSAPAAKYAHIINVGDFFHTENKQGVTARGGNILDTDSRLGKMVDFGTAALKQMIYAALTVHEEVSVWCIPGNHDDLLAWMLARQLSEHYRNEPRVTVDTEPSFFFYREFGKNLIGGTHGHGPKPQELASVMAVDQSEAWGRTRHWNWFTGHIHHKTKVVMKEHQKVVVESFNTLAPGDLWHHSKGYRSRRNMQTITLHTDWGETERHTVDISQLEAA